jgi:hypothetical protein
VVEHAPHILHLLRVHVMVAWLIECLCLRPHRDREATVCFFDHGADILKQRKNIVPFDVVSRRTVEDGFHSDLMMTIEMRSVCHLEPPWCCGNPSCSSLNFTTVEGSGDAADGLGPQLRGG